MGGQIIRFIRMGGKKSDFISFSFPVKSSSVQKILCDI